MEQQRNEQELFKAPGFREKNLGKHLQCGEKLWVKYLNAGVLLQEAAGGDTEPPRRRKGWWRGQQPRVGGTHTHCSGTDPLQDHGPWLQPPNQLQPTQAPAVGKDGRFLPCSDPPPPIWWHEQVQVTQPTAIKATPSRPDKRHSWRTAMSHRPWLGVPLTSAEPKPAPS